MYFSGQGKLFVAKRDEDGVPGAFRWVGNVPDFVPKFETSKVEHKESWSGQRLTDKNLNTENKSTFSATLEDWMKENVALATRSNVVALSGGAVTNELSPPEADVVPGAIWALAGTNVSSVVITDSAGTPLTVNSSKYAVDADYGTVTFNDTFDPDDYTFPLKAAYTAAASQSAVPFFTAGQEEYAIRFEGVNTADANRRVLVELYRVAPDPTQELPLITEEFGQFTIEGNVLIDATKGNDPEFGRFGRLVYVDEPSA